MTTVRTTIEVDELGLARILSPRDDTVAEERVDETTFGLADGPFESYMRSVSVEELGADRFRVTETTRFRLAIPYWGPMFALLYRRALKSHPGARAVTPWWAPPDRLSARSSRVLSLLCMLSIVTGFLGSLMSQTLTFAADEFGVNEGSQGKVLAAVRVGAILTIGIIALADRRGRRVVLVAASAAGCAFASLGAVAPNIFLLGAGQTFSRACSLAVGVLILIVAAEEMPAGSRAYAVSVTTMTGALGAGIVLFALPIADLGESAWRIIYLVPLLGILPIARIGRVLPETARFEASRAAASAGLDRSNSRSADEANRRLPIGVEVGGPDQDDWVLIEDEKAIAGPAVAAGGGVQSARGRFVILAASAFLGTLLFAPASQFQNEFLRDAHDFTAPQIALYTMLTNIPGGIGIVAGGRLADVYGRKRVGALALLLGSIFTAVRFLGSGPWLWLGGVLGSITGAAAVPALGVYGPELFPTDRRGSANGGITLFGVAGSVIALLVVGSLAERWDGLGEPIALMAIGPALLALLILVAYPETANLELEELNPEDRDLLLGA